MERAPTVITVDAVHEEKLEAGVRVENTSTPSDTTAAH